MCSKVLKTCSNVFKTCSSVFKCVCTLFKCVQICSNVFKICSNVLNCVQNLFKCFWTLFKCVQMISYVFKCVQVMVMGGLWVAKVGFGRLKVVIGGYEWLSGVCVWVLPWKCNPDNKSSLQNVSSWQNVHHWQNVQPDKMSILTKHTFLTKRLLTFSQHKSWALKHGRKSSIQLHGNWNVSIQLHEIDTIQLSWVECPDTLHAEKPRFQS